MSRESVNTNAKIRYYMDAEFREKKRNYYLKNKKHIKSVQKKYQAEHRAQINARFKERYHYDAQFRAAYLKKRRENGKTRKQINDKP